MKRPYLIPILLFSLLFLSCQGITPGPTPAPPPGGGEAPTPETKTDRVVLVELFNVEGCPACKVINPIVEDLITEYSTDEVILVELKGWLKGATPETEERFKWYVPQDKHTPFIAFNGLSDSFSEGVSGGGGGGGSGGTVTHSSIKGFSGFTYTGFSPLESHDIVGIKDGVLPRMSNFAREDNTNIFSRGSYYNAIYLTWEEYRDCEGFKIYRSVNSTDIKDYVMIKEMDLSMSETSEDIILYQDRDYEQGNTYRYYVTAYNNTKKWETTRSNIFVITINNNTFLPPISLQNPMENESIDNPEYLFKWTHNNIGLPFGEISSGDTLIYVTDKENPSSTMMETVLNEINHFEEKYDGFPLIPGKTYSWNVGCVGYNASGQIISLSLGEERDFSYNGELVGISDIYATAITYQDPDIDEHQGKMKQLNTIKKDRNIYFSNQLSNSRKGITKYVSSIDWDFYFNTTGFKIYRNENGGDWVLLDNWSVLPGYNYYTYYDYDVLEGNAYTYRVTAYGSGWETEPSPEVTIDTWLPPCSLVSPLDGATIKDSKPTFSWDPVGITAPHGSIMDVKSDLWVYDSTSKVISWQPLFVDTTTSTQIYNSDGKGASLVSGHEYVWNSWAYGFDKDGDLIAVSQSEDWEFKVTLTGDTVRRALLIGIGDYINYGSNNGDLKAPPYDVAMIQETLEHSYVFAEMEYLLDHFATKKEILNGIASTFAEAEDNDISYFYFSGHGAYDQSSKKSYLCPADFNGTVSTAISITELETALDNINGTKVVFIDSCHSGGFIGKSLNLKETLDFVQSFNDSVINTFMVNDFSKRDLAKSQYQVVTACLSTQESVEIHPSPGDPYGLFTKYLCEGCGYGDYTFPYKADSNGNREITLHEAYTYTYDQVETFKDNWNQTHDKPGDKIYQDTQIYPENSTFVIIKDSNG